MQMYVAIFILFINILLWFWFFRAFKKRYSPEKVLERIRLEVDKLIITINNETDRDVTLIEARITGLKKLIQEADKRLQLSETEIEKRKNEQQILDSLHVQQSPVEKNTVQTRLSRYEQVNQPEQTPMQSENNAVEVAVPPEFFNQPEQTIAVSQNPVPLHASKQDEVLKLHALGFDEQMIASKLALSIGEVNFIINLSKI